MSRIRDALDTLRTESRTSRPDDPRVSESKDPATREIVEAFAENEGDSGQQKISGPERLAVERVPTRTNVSVEPVPGAMLDIQRHLLIDERLAPGDEDREVIAQQFRRIKRPILQAAFERGLPVGDNANVTMVASALPGAGKTFCAFNLAQSIALEQDVGVLLVDADVLKPGLSASIGLEENKGLIDYLADPQCRLEDVLVGTNMDDIVVLPSGRRHEQATELLASRRMKGLVEHLSDVYKDRVVVFDTPPLLLTNEAQVLARIVGQIVLVIEAGVSSQESVIRALDLLDREKPINAILNKSRNAVGSNSGHASYGYYPYSYGGYGGDFDT